MDNVALRIGPITIYWYSIFIVVGILLAMPMLFKEVKRQKLNKEFMINLIFYKLNYKKVLEN